jgi:hypothetical protein
LSNTQKKGEKGTMISCLLTLPKMDTVPLLIGCRETHTPLKGEKKIQIIDVNENPFLPWPTPLPPHGKKETHRNTKESSCIPTWCSVFIQPELGNRMLLFNWSLMLCYSLILKIIFYFLF